MGSVRGVFGVAIGVLKSVGGHLENSIIKSFRDLQSINQVDEKQTCFDFSGPLSVYCTNRDSIN